NSLTYGQDESGQTLSFRWDYIMIFTGLTFLKGGGTGTTGLLNNMRSLLWIKIQQYTTRSIQIKLFTHLHRQVYLPKIIYVWAHGETLHT
ncbi:hypothetical protein RRG08_052237, partial [Elysia crispata]